MPSARLPCEPHVSINSRLFGFDKTANKSREHWPKTHCTNSPHPMGQCLEHSRTTHHPMIYSPCSLELLFKPLARPRSPVFLAHAGATRGAAGATASHGLCVGEVLATASLSESPAVDPGRFLWIRRSPEKRDEPAYCSCIGYR